MLYLNLIFTPHGNSLASHLTGSNLSTQNGVATFSFGVNAYGSIQHPPKRDIVHHQNVKILNKSSMCLQKDNLHERLTAPGKRELGQSQDVDAML
jgi:hypothetical protein